MLPEADKIYQGTSQINLSTGPGRPWCRYATGVMGVKRPPLPESYWESLKSGVLA